MLSTYQEREIREGFQMRGGMGLRVTFTGGTSKEERAKYEKSERAGYISRDFLMV